MPSKFENVNVYSATFGALKRRAAITIPGVGIIVNPKDKNNLDLLRHEFGHILQLRKYGISYFVFKIAFQSIFSAMKANRDRHYNHMSCFTEWTANQLSYDYFNSPSDWNFDKYPIKAVSAKNNK
jgi:hypothetical protein